LHNLIAKAESLNLGLKATDFNHLDFERVYTIKAAYNETMAAKLKSKGR